MKKLTIILLTILFAGLLSSFVSNYFQITKNLEIFNNIYRELETSYVEDISPGELMHKTIDNMLDHLDPWTIYIPESEVEDYRERSITGEYGGIGSKIRKVDDFVVIAEPFLNSPADKVGLEIGDKILAINGEQMENVNTEDVSDLLRGSPGTMVDVKLQTIQNDIKSVEILREKIHTPTVPYYELLKNDVGYVRLTQFKRRSSQEVKSAIDNLDSLSHNTLNGLILDLRNNPGGLLGECLQILNLFIPKNDTILTAKGKNTSWDKEYITKKTAIYKDIPIIVLINSHSASASEIIAGCLQDLDRGVVMGETSFGKGLIQQNQKLAYNTQLKLTVAKYYTPSGRCIQNRYANKNGKREEISDSLRSEFFTRSGRKVYGGGGVNPDITISKPETGSIIINLIKENCIFKFANKIYPSIDFPKSAKNFQISDETYSSFIEYIDEINFQFNIYSEEVVELLEEALSEEQYLESMENDIKLLKSNILSNKKQDLIRHKSEIQKYITNELILRKFYKKGVIEHNITIDPYIKHALDIFSDTNQYTSILLPE